jgi:hemerythrin-like domain-containing protein
MTAREPVDSSDPFSMLLRCHRRLEERLQDLEAAGGLGPEEAREVAENVLGFLDRAVARHELDEEQSLFPRLAVRPDLAQALATLGREHREQTQIIERFRQAHAGGTLDPGAIAAFARELGAAYAGHIALEENELFPAARSLLGPDSLADMAREMEERRAATGGGGHRHRSRG